MVLVVVVEVEVDVAVVEYVVVKVGFAVIYRR